MASTISTWMKADLSVQRKGGRLFGGGRHLQYPEEAEDNIAKWILEQCDMIYITTVIAIRIVISYLL